MKNKKKENFGRRRHVERIKAVQKHLQILTTVRRKKHHPLIHHVHKKYGISRKTLFYVKEYGPKANVPGTIVRESIRIMLFASIISSFGGLSLEQIKMSFISIIPLIILLPALNDMIGDYGIIISSRFSTMLHEGVAYNRWWRIPELKRLFFQVFIMSLITAAIGSTIALATSWVSGYAVNEALVYKIFFISMLDTVLLVSVLFLVSVFAGIYFFRKEEDPNNFLIPITTSLADFGNMIILSLLVILLF
jgi:cation transporter-like permease